MGTICPWAFGLSVFTAPAFLRREIEGAGICGGFICVEGVQLMKEEGGSTVAARGKIHVGWCME